MAARSLVPGLLLLLAACEVAPPEVPPLTEGLLRARWLPGFKDGKTTLASATGALGPPAAFEGGRLAVWRLLLVHDADLLDDTVLDDELDEIEHLWFDPHAPWRPVHLAGVAERRARFLESGALLAAGAAPPPGFPRHALVREAEFHLVAVFGPDGVLRRHSLVPVGP